MNKNQYKKYFCVILLGLSTFALAACICFDSEEKCDATLDQKVRDFETSYSGAKISIEKSADVTTITKVGQVITYSYTIINTGSALFNTINVQDDKIAVSCPEIHSLNSGQSTTCSGTYTVSEDDLAVGAVNNAASVDATSTTTFTCEFGKFSLMERTATASAHASTTLSIAFGIQPALSLSKTVAPEFYSGGQWVTYTYTLTNTGNVPLGQPFTISDDKVPDGWSCDPQAELLPGSSLTCSADFLIDAGLRWTITNIATACGTYQEQQICSESASASVLFSQPTVVPNPSPAKIGPYCGDGVVNQSSEECDPPDGIECGPDCKYLE